MRTISLIIWGLFMGLTGLKAQDFNKNTTNWNISGFGLGAVSFCPSAGTSPVDFLDVLNEQERDGVFMRINLTYDSPEGGGKARFEVDPTNGTTPSGSVVPTVAIKFAEAYVKFKSTQLRFDVGSLRDTTFALKSLMTNNDNSPLYVGVIPSSSTFSSNAFPLRPSWGFGYEAKEIWAPTGGFISGVTGISASWSPSFIPGLQLTLVTPVQTTSSDPIKASSWNSWSSGLDYFAAYKKQGLGQIKLGYMGAATNQDWSNFFGTIDLEVGQTAGFKASAGIEVLSTAQALVDNSPHHSSNLFVTALYDFRLWGCKVLDLSEDFGLFTSGTTFGKLIAEDRPGFSTSTRLRYKVLGIAPKLNMTSDLTYRFFDDLGTQNYWSNGTELNLTFTTGSAKLAVGAGLYYSNTAPATSVSVLTLGTLWSW